MHITHDQFILRNMQFCSFRLTKDSKPLKSQEYADNLSEYLDTARQVKNLTLADLNMVLHGLSSQAIKTVDTITPGTSTSDADTAIQSTNHPYTLGEHIAAVWWEGNVCRWHLGVVDEILEGNSKCDLPSV